MKELVEGDEPVAVVVELHAHGEEVVHLLRRVVRGQLQHEFPDLNLLSRLVDDVHEELGDRLTLLLDDPLEHALEEADRLSDLPWDFIVLVPELNLFEN